MFPFTIQTLSGQSTILQVATSDLIETIKLQIQKTWGIPIYHQRIVLAGKVLEDGHTLDDYNISEKDNCQATVLLEGWRQNI